MVIYVSHGINKIIHTSVLEDPTSWKQHLCCYKTFMDDSSSFQESKYV